MKELSKEEKNKKILDILKTSEGKKALADAFFTEFRRAELRYREEGSLEQRIIAACMKDIDKNVE